MIVHELILTAEHGAWTELRIGLFASREKAMTWITDNYPDLSEEERGYLFSITDIELDQGKRIDFWKKAS